MLVLIHVLELDLDFEIVRKAPSSSIFITISWRPHYTEEYSTFPDYTCIQKNHSSVNRLNEDPK